MKKLNNCKSSIKFSLLVCFGLMFSTMVFAENKLQDSVVTVSISPKIDKAFAKDYPEATKVLWRIKNSPDNKFIAAYIAEFYLKDEKFFVYYNKAGKQIEVRNDIMVNQLPATIYTAIHEKYPDVEVMSAQRVKSKSKKVAYIVIVKMKPIKSDDPVELKEVSLHDSGKIYE